MSTPTKENGNPTPRFRQAAGVKAYADIFPYVNGGLFEDAGEVPRFSRAARNYLLHASELDWKEINPDIFGLVIQAVAPRRRHHGGHHSHAPRRRGSDSEQQDCAVRVLRSARTVVHLPFRT